MKYPLLALVFMLAAPIPSGADDAVAPDKPAQWEVLMVQRGAACWVRVDGKVRTPAPDLLVPSLGSRHKDGRWLTANHRNGNRDIWLMPKKVGPGGKRLTEHAAEDAEPAWLPDGKSFVFASRRDGLWQLYRKSVGGGKAERLTRSERETREPAVNPNGKSVAYVELQPTRGFVKIQPGDVKLLNLADRSERVLLDRVHVLEMAFSPDGKRLAVSHASGLDIVEVKTGKAKRIVWRDVDPKMDSHGAWSMSWHPDGRVLASRIEFLGGRRVGSGPIRGDDTLFFFDPSKKKIELREIPLPAGTRGGVHAWRKLKKKAPDGKK